MFNYTIPSKIFPLSIPIFITIFSFSKKANVSHPKIYIYIFSEIYIYFTKIQQKNRTCIL